MRIQTALAAADTLFQILDSRRVRWLIVLVVIYFIGREFDERFMSRIRARYGTRWGEPYVSPEQHRMGLWMMLAGIVIAGVLVTITQNACPRIE